FFCAVPTSLPINPRGATSVPSAGPYYIASYTPKRLLILRRNPNYSGPRPHKLAEIVYTLGVSRDTTLRQVERGAADYAVGALPETADARVAQRFGPESPAAKAGAQRYFVNPTLNLIFLSLNTARPLFRDVKLRKAVNFAVDRSALASLSGIFSGDPTDQYLAPGFPGFTNADIYPLKPDLVRARRLAGGRGGTAVFYTPAIPGALEQAQILQANLRAIGIDLVIKQFPFDELYSRAGRRGEPFDIVFGGWAPDYPDPGNVLNVLFDGSSIRPEGNPNSSYFNDGGSNKRLQAAARRSGPRRYAEYGRLDISLARDAAPLVALYTLTQRDFFSARIGCQVYNPIYGMDIAALCLRR
ncbi:MAG: ABC transporter substrate-binding protein, partial [Actinomycetota bacterium]|nr:ABC transporter substrate-binding protein [Actinomycetota bacterium]